MPLDDDVRALLAAEQAAEAEAPVELSIGEARLLQRQPYLERAVRTPVSGVEERTLAGPGGPLPLRIYLPDAAAPRPLVVYLHGGGFVYGGLDTHDEACRRLCRGAGTVVVSVAYRLAPEAPFPAAVEDAEHATRWAAGHAEALGARAEQVVVAGDSAGANLAAVVARRLRDAGGPELAGQLLVYPVTDLRAEAYPSRIELGEGYGLTSQEMTWFGERYLRDANDALHPDASPIVTHDLRDLPPALVLTAEFDPLRDEGAAYAKRLADAGVEVQHVCVPGTIHGVLTKLDPLASREEAWRSVLGWLQGLVGGGGGAEADHEGSQGTFP